ncbi:MAG: polysaccharide biosynthesis/export family protein [Planctomycetota bacterium]
MARVAQLAIVVLWLFLAAVFLGGCGGGKGDYLDPTQVGRFRSVPSVNVILETLGVAEESASAYEGAEEPRPADVISMDEDYVLHPGDSIRISIFELLAERTPFVQDFEVTETGKISIPEVGPLQAAGLTEAQLEEDIKRILSPTILKEPSVSVLLLSSPSRTYTVLGAGIPRPNRYGIPRHGLRLAEALAAAGSPDQFNVSYIYVTRAITGAEEFVTGQESMPDQAPAAERGESPDRAEPGTRQRDVLSPEEMLDVLAPCVQDNSAEFVVTSSEMATEDELEQIAMPQGVGSVGKAGEFDLEEILSRPKSGPNRRGSAEKKVAKSSKKPARVEWVYEDGKWVPVPAGEPGELMREDTTAIGKPQQVEPLEKTVPKDFGWEQIGTAGVQRRVIKISADKLLGGDPRYNIVIKAGDTISVPLDVVGFYYVWNNFNRQGEYPLTGRSMTLKMAVAAAGGLGPLAWPQKVEVVRRLAENKEEIVLVDLKKIAEGSQPDFFMKPKDIINVGTHPTARWLAVLRNAFRATYGFGFIYDRNFADRDFGKHRNLDSIPFL